MTFWTGREIALATRFWREGASQIEIARALGRSRNAVAGFIDRRGLQRKFTDDAARAAHIAKRREADRVREALRSRGRTPRIIPELELVAAAMHFDDGASLAEICAETGLTEEQVGQAIQRAKWRERNARHRAKEKGRRRANGDPAHAQAS